MTSNESDLMHIIMLMSEDFLYVYSVLITKSNYLSPEVDSIFAKRNEFCLLGNTICLNKPAIHLVVW